jgi:hypothetical protein
MTTVTSGERPDPTGGRAEVVALEKLIAESQQLRADMHESQDQQQYRFRWLQIFIGVLIVAVAVLGTLVLQNQRISAQIADCTTAGGACWEESRQRSKNNVSAILNSTIFVAECLQRFPHQPTQEQELEACVRRELATNRQPVPPPASVPPAPSAGPTR